MTMNELIKYMEKSKVRVEKERRENPLKKMTDEEKVFYDRCKAEEYIATPVNK